MSSYRAAFRALKLAYGDDLGKEVDMGETKQALKDMGSYRAPGLDGFQAIFLKKTWHTMGETVHHFVKKVFEDGNISEGAAEALLVLIPKGTRPCNIRGFRPLSLCNVAYKLTSKVIVNRLKSIMKQLISPCQVIFVPGR